MSRLRSGLPYGWWKSADVWAALLFLFTLCPLMLLLLVAWFAPNLIAPWLP